MPPCKRILCADDDPDTLDLMKVWLGSEGYEVITAATVSEAVGIAGSEFFDFYLLDDWFPDGGGDELISGIRTIDARTPVVFFSGDVRTANREQLMKLGAQAFIPKPSDLAIVSDTIRQLLSEDTPVV